MTACNTPIACYTVRPEDPNKPPRKTLPGNVRIDGNIQDAYARYAQSVVAGGGTPISKGLKLNEVIRGSDWYRHYGTAARVVGTGDYADDKPKRPDRDVADPEEDATPDSTD